MTRNPIVQRQKPRQIDPGNDRAGVRIDARYAIRLPDVGQNRPLKPFQLVELIYGPASSGHMDAAQFMQGLRIQDAQLRCAVAHDDLAVITGQRPTFTRILEMTLHRESVQVVDEADLRLPGQADQTIAPVGNTLTEVLRRQVVVEHDLAGFQADLTNARVPLEAGALIQVAFQIEEALREGVRVVRVGVYHLVRVGRDRRLVHCPRRWGRKYCQGAENQARSEVRPQSLSHHLPRNGKTQTRPYLYSSSDVGRWSGSGDYHRWWPLAHVVDMFCTCE